MGEFIALAVLVFGLWAIVAFVQMIWRAITGGSAQPELPPNPWDQVNAVVAMPVQRPDGSLEQAKITWESIPAPGSQQPRAAGRRP